MNFFIIRKRDEKSTRYHFFSTVDLFGVDHGIEGGTFRFANASVFSRDECTAILAKYPTAERVQIG